jgi:hypothetical protein
MPSSAQLSQLRSAILAAFDGVTRPAPPEIAPHECERCAAVCTTFANLDWRAVPPALLEEHASVLPLFSAEAYAYFLGAWLLYALDHFTPAALPSEMLVYNLAPDESPDEDAEEWRRAKRRHLTSDQLAVIEQFLDVVETDTRFADRVGDLTAGRARYRAQWEKRWES